MKYSPNPRVTITCARRIVHVAAAQRPSPPRRVCTSAIAASRASRTAVHTSCARADGVPTCAIQV